MGTVQSINERLKQFRLLNRFSQSEMAELLNVSSSQYSKIENNKCHLNLHHIEALASNLGKDFSEIYNALKEVNKNDINQLKWQNDSTSKNTNPPHLKVPFELALKRLKAFCIENNYVIVIDSNGDIQLSEK